MGRRMGSRKKNYLTLIDRPVLAHTLGVFEASPLVDSIILVVPHSDERFCREEIAWRYGLSKVAKIIAGGKERQDSVGNGLLEAAGYGLIMVHDGARPLVTADMIENILKAASVYGAAIAAVPVKDTVKEGYGGLVSRTLPREGLWSVQTPQAFRSDIITGAFEKACKDGFTGTDESSLVERLGTPVRIVEGSYENIKITTEEDMVMAECILARRKKAAL